MREGRLDFGIVREDAIPAGPGKGKLSLVKLTFHLCIPKKLLKPGTPATDLGKPSLWQTLPFTAGNDGGQLDTTIRGAMHDAGVDFRPVVECQSMLQARQLVQQGDCAGILPSLGLTGLSTKETHIIEFPPLKRYGRQLVLHWNERQRRRRGVSASLVQQVALSLRGG
ncbi:MAG: hypothetical protein JNM99_01820 [Verrucomicrobiaceae bacterium]|nr:hypothetical protein [Verrucomicrobiaceae bacterium]